MSNGETTNALLAFVKKRPGELAAASMSVLAVGAVVAALTVSSGPGTSADAPVEGDGLPEATSLAVSTASSSDLVTLHMLANPLASLPAERVGSAEKLALESALAEVQTAITESSENVEASQSAYVALQSAIGSMASTTLELARVQRLQVTLATADILSAYDAALLELERASDDRTRVSGISAVVRQGTAAQSSHSSAVEQQQNGKPKATDDPTQGTPPENEPPQSSQPPAPGPPAMTGSPVPDGSGGPASPAEPEQTTQPPAPPTASPEPTEPPTSPAPSESASPSEESSQTGP